MGPITLPDVGGWSRRLGRHGDISWRRRRKKKGRKKVHSAQSVGGQSRANTPKF